jgi:predicted acetyltransferase
MELVLPSVEYKASFIEAVKEYQQDVENIHMYERYRRLSISELETDFAAFVEKELSYALGLNLPEGYVPETTFWLIEHDEFLGRISIRHQINEHLKKIGGHIGYDIRPSKRKHGYGNKILELALPKAKGLGIQRALLTCDATNVASRKIIERNGGLLEDQVPNPETGVDKLRYWIDVS